MAPELTSRLQAIHYRHRKIQAHKTQTQLPRPSRSHLSQSLPPHTPSHLPENHWTGKYKNQWLWATFILPTILSRFTVTPRMSPAMAAGVEARLWSIEDLVALWEVYEQRRAERAA